LRSPNDPRNQSPAVGTGGPEGGPTGLFTIYDGSTLRRGEFTFSIAYSNYDRDPGNVDIVDVPLSFNVGINDHIELFFKTNGYRGIKVNNPQNLSSFYLPNSQLFCGATLCSRTSDRSGAIWTKRRNARGHRRISAAEQSAVRAVSVRRRLRRNVSSGTGQWQQFGFPGFNAQLGPPWSSRTAATLVRLTTSRDRFAGRRHPAGVVLATTRFRRQR
jgi:hypothetical protein